MCPVEVAADGLKEGFLVVYFIGEGADAKDLNEVEDVQPTSPSDKGRLSLRVRLEDNVKVIRTFR